MQLDPRFGFDNYVVGSANRLAVAAARAVAESPGTSYNPLVLYSSSGLGKTHLMVAIGNLALQLQPHLRVVMDSLDEFIDELHAAISAGQMDRFKQRYNDVDLLLLDDVQFLAGRTETQAEMLRVFNVMQHVGRQIVLTSDRPPGEIAELDERLITRLSGGLIVDIGVPDYETRVAIARRKCEERGVHLDGAVIAELARIDFRNVRELQGALNRLAAHQMLEGTAVAPSQVRGLIGERTPALGVARYPVESAASGSVNGTRVSISEMPPAAAEEEFQSFISGLAAAVGPQLAPESAPPSAPARPPEAVSDRVAPPLIDDIDAAIEQALDFGAEPRAASNGHRPSAPSLPAPSPLLLRTTFEVSSSNQLAVRAADAVSLAPGVAYNPLLVHGPRGVGKTHLLHAIGNALAGRGIAAAVVSVPQMVDEIVAALENGGIDAWRARYREAGALVLDEVQEIGGKQRTQEELFHLFNALHAAGRQIVLASDRAPRRLQAVDERLTTRFEAGLVVEIRPPDAELATRLARRELVRAGVEPDAALLSFLGARPVATVLEIIDNARHLAAAAAEAGVKLSASFAARELDGAEARDPAAAGSLDGFFMDPEKVLLDWPFASERVIEDLH